MNNDMKKIIGIERCVVLQAIAEGYLLRTTGKHFNEEFPNVKESYGVILEQHSQLLKKFLKDEYASRNLDINECIEKRKEAKLNKDYNLADTIRKELEEKGIILKDTREGTTFEVIK